jgi:hypothetical protein
MASQSTKLFTKKSDFFPILISVLCLLIVLLGKLHAQPIFTQNFDGAWTNAGSLSPAWTETHSVAAAEWKRDDQYSGSGLYSPVYAGGSHSARFNSYNASSGSNGQLISPTIDFSTVGNKKLDFYIIDVDGGDSLTVYLSIDNGTSWARVSTLTANYTSWTKVTLDLGSSTSTTCKIKFKGISDWGSTDVGLDEVKVYIPVAMSFVSSAATQSVTTPIPPLSPSQQIIGVQVVTTGSLTPLSTTKLSFITTGSTAPLTDITCATLYYTGTSSTFSTAISVGSVYSQPNGRFRFTDNITLSEGTNYFWLTYDVPYDAVTGDFVDAQIDTLVVNSVTYTPSSAPAINTPDPGSGRLIATPYNMDNNGLTICAGGLYDDGGPSGNYASGAKTYTKIITPGTSGNVIKVVFSEFITEVTTDNLTIYDGPDATYPSLGTFSGDLSASLPGGASGLIATSITGQLTFKWVSANATVNKGFSALISCITPTLPNCANTPAPTGTGINCNTNLTWSAPTVDGTHYAAAGYKIYFGTSSGNYNIANGLDVGNVLTWGTALNATTWYYYKIVPYNLAGDASGCTEQSFQTNSTNTPITFTVPGSYATIKAAYNACTGANAYIIEVNSGYAGEAYPIKLNNDVAAVVTNRSGACPITIRPGTIGSYTFSSATDTIFVFRGGAKYITIDGRVGSTGSAKKLTIKTTVNTRPTIAFTKTTSYNTIKYCRIEGVATTAQGIVVVYPNGAFTIRDITIDNDSISSGATQASCGIYVDGHTNAGVVDGLVKNITISNNKIEDIWANSSTSTFIYLGYIYGSVNPDAVINCTLSGNSLYYKSSATHTPTGAVSVGCIKIYGNHHKISNNFIGGTAVSCGGTPMTIATSATTYDNTFSGIMITGTSGSTTTISGNTIKNITLYSAKYFSNDLTSINRGLNTGPSAFVGIGIREGSATISNNNIGAASAIDINVISTAGSAGNATESTGVFLSSATGTTTVTGNTVAGIKSWPNTVTNHIRIIGIGTFTDNTVTNYNYTYNINNNTVDSLVAGVLGSTTGNGFVIGIYTGNGEGRHYIKYNVVKRLYVNASGNAGLIRGIYNDDGFFAELENNTVYTLVTSATTNYATDPNNIYYRAILGLTSTDDNGGEDHFFVSKNTVYDIRSRAINVQQFLTGIYYRHAAAPTYGRVFGNKVYSINGVPTGNTATGYSSIMVGIWAYGQNTITYNNMITLGSNVSNSVAGCNCPTSPLLATGNYEYRGIDNYYGKNEYYYNTVNIIGTATGTINSYAYRFSCGAIYPISRILKDNIFSNTRVTTGGGINYAFSINTFEESGTAHFTSDYNYFYITDPNSYLFDNKGTPTNTIPNWIAGKDVHSSGGTTIAADPLFVAPNGCNGDLNITNPLSPVNNAGTTSGIPTYILIDFFGTPRAGTNDIGAVVIGDAPFPIELFVFTAEKYAAGKALIEWITTSETNNDYFTIERSSDGETFKAFDIIPGAGNSNTTMSYQTFDNNPFEGINYYRLKQTDYDGTSSYSQIVSVDFSKKEYETNIYPNPFSDQLVINLSGYDGGDTIITLLDLTGRAVPSARFLKSGNDIIMTCGDDISEGYYFVKIQNEKNCNYFKVLRINSK